MEDVQTQSVTNKKTVDIDAYVEDGALHFSGPETFLNALTNVAAADEESLNAW